MSMQIVTGSLLPPLPSHISLSLAPATITSNIIFLLSTPLRPSFLISLICQLYFPDIFFQFSDYFFKFNFCNFFCVFFFSSFSEKISVSYSCPALLVSFISRFPGCFFFLFYFSKKIASHLYCVTILVLLLVPIHLHTLKKRASIFLLFLVQECFILVRERTFNIIIFFINILFLLFKKFILNFVEVVLVLFCINHTRIIFILFLLFKKNYVSSPQILLKVFLALPYRDQRVKSGQHLSSQ